MTIEIEAKFLNVDHDALRSVLSRAMFSCIQPQYLMRRVVFDSPSLFGTKAWARVRDEAGVITMSYKKVIDSSRADGVEEIQLIVDNFDQACRFMEACGLERKAYQETRREVWRRGDAEVFLDEWPMLPPFVELEAPTEEGLKNLSVELGFDWQQAVFGAVGGIYKRHGISPAAINAYPRVTFDNIDEIRHLIGTANID